MEERGRARWLLVAGCTAGIALAALGLVRGASLPAEALASGEAARVNGVPIRSAVLERAVGALAADKREPLAAADRARALDRLVEEELLVQRALEIGLAQSEPSVRGALVQAMVDSVVAEVESREPDPAQLRRFYEENRSYFGAGERLRVERLVFRPGTRSADPGARAREAQRALSAGEPLEAVAERLADEPLLPLPGGLLPAPKLREYLGPDLVDVLLAAPDARWLDPLEGAEGVQLLRVLERRAAGDAAFEEVAPQVEAEWRRRESDRALRSYLDRLRADAEIVLAPGAAE